MHYCRRATWKRRENEANDRAPENDLSQNMIRMIKINQAKQESFEMEELDQEWDENCVEIEELSATDNNGDADKGYVSCEEKDKIFLTETPTEHEEPCIVSFPEADLEEDSQSTINVQCQNQFSEYPIKNLIR